MNHTTLLSTIVALLVLFEGSCASYFDYKEKVETLTDLSSTFVWNSNKTAVTYAIEDLEDNPSLYVWIDEMTCSMYPPGSYEPNYLIIASNSEGVDLQRWDLCANVKNFSPVIISSFNNGLDNLRLTNITITPVGLWSPNMYTATIRLEIRRPNNKYRLGRALQNVELHLNSNKDEDQEYEIKLDDQNDLCKQLETKSNTNDDGKKENDYITFCNSSLHMVVVNMDCDSTTFTIEEKGDDDSNSDENDKDDKSSFLLVRTIDKEGEEGVVYKCTSSDGGKKKKSGSNVGKTLSFTSIQSTGSVHLYVSKGKDLKTTVSVTPQLRAESSGKLTCPENYFNCFNPEYCHSNEYIPESSISCIPLDSTCNGKPNCPSDCPNADENKKFCKVKLSNGDDENDDDECYYDGSYWYYTGGFSIWQSIFGFLFFLTGFILIGLVCRAVYIRRMGMRARSEPMSYRPETVSPEVMKARMAPPPSYGEVTRNGHSYA